MSFSQQTEQTSMGLPALGSRFLLWIDGVGGYLVCLQAEVSLGQALPESGVDIAIQGDLSRRHLKFQRGPDADLVEPFGRVRLEGQTITTPTLLRTEADLLLGRGVRLRYRRSHPLSDSARLDFGSRHRTSPWTDGILLMGSTLMLGPQANQHVRCSEWPEGLLLFRRGDELRVRGPEHFEVDGRSVSGEARLSFQSRVEGEGFSFSLEPL